MGMMQLSNNVQTVFLRQHLCSVHAIDVREQCADHFGPPLAAALLLPYRVDAEFVIALTFTITNLDDSCEFQKIANAYFYLLLFMI